MRYPSFDIAWNDIQENPQLMHEVVLEWENNNVQDPAMLGLISRYHVHQGNVGIVISEMLQFKTGILNAIPKKKSDVWKSYVAAAAVAGLIALGTLWIWNSSNRRTWSYQDEGIPQYMDDKSVSLDWSTINYCYQKKDYSGMMEKIKMNESIQSNNDTLLYYKAICFLEMNQCDSALSYFEKVLELTTIYHDRAQYFVFHLQKDGPNYLGLRSLQPLNDPMLKQAIQRDIVH